MLIGRMPRAFAPFLQSAIRIQQSTISAIYREFNRRPDLERFRRLVSALAIAAAHAPAAATAHAPKPAETATASFARRLLDLRRLQSESDQRTRFGFDRIRRVG